MFDLVEFGDLLVFNNICVIFVWLLGQKVSGGKVEVFIECIVDDNNVLVYVWVSKVLKFGMDLLLEGVVSVMVIGCQDVLFEFWFNGDVIVFE